MNRLPQVVVIAGGLGTRLGALGRQRPKILQEVAGRPFVDWMLQPLIAQGFEHFEFCLGHMADQVMEYLDKHWSGLTFCYHVEKEPSGTAGAVRHLGEHLDEQFLTVLGDTYLNIDYRSLCSGIGDEMQAIMAVTGHQSDVPGNVELESSRVERYHKDPPQNLPWVDCGVLFMRRSALAVLADLNGPVDLGVLFQRLIDHRQLAGRRVSEHFYDIGSPQRISEFEDFALRNLTAP